MVLFLIARKHNIKILKIMKKLLLVCTMFFLGQSAFAQAWNGKGDQKLQVGFNGWGYENGITGTYDYGLGKIVSIGAGANVYFGTGLLCMYENALAILPITTSGLKSPLQTMAILLGT